MRRLFNLFLKKEGLTILSMPSKQGLCELSVNFNHWANTPPRSNRQGTAVFNVRSYVSKRLSLVK